MKPGGCDAGVTSTQFGGKKGEEKEPAWWVPPSSPAPFSSSASAIAAREDSQLAAPPTSAKPGRPPAGSSEKLTELTNPSVWPRTTSLCVSVTVGAQKEKRKFLQGMDKQKKSKEEVKVESRKVNNWSVFIGRESPVCPHWGFFLPLFVSSCTSCQAQIQSSSSCGGR